VTSWHVLPGSSAWKQGIARPGVTSALKLLTSMAADHASSAEQMVLAGDGESARAATITTSSSGVGAAGSSSTSSPTPPPRLLQLLHVLEGVAGGAVVAPLAEALLDALVAACGAASPIAAAVLELRSASQRRAKEMAARRRQAMLSSMGVSPVRVTADSGAGTPVGPLSPGWPGSASMSGRMASATPPSATAVVSAGSAWQRRATHSSSGAQGGGATLEHTSEGASGSGGAAATTTLVTQTGFDVAGADGGGGGSSGAAATAATASAVRAPRPTADLALVSPAGSQLASELAALEAEEADEEEEQHLRCMVCREGYRLRPHELLCAYVHCKPVYRVGGAAAAAAAASGGMPVGGTAAMLIPEGLPVAAAYASVTHFNLIHASCHASARTADAALRQPKREWDGATLRNGQVGAAYCMLLPGRVSAPQGC
jgi:hypothetical protein